MINKEKHHAVLVEILQDIYGTKEISSLLGFKGDTAAYIFYDLPRFSVDLDFDLIEEGKEVEALVFEKVLGIAKKYGEIRDKAIKHFTLYFALTYEIGQHQIKVEISRRSASAQYELKNYLGIPMSVMKTPDVAANKLLALTERKRFANRDLFDVHYFLKKNFPINEDLIRETTGKSLEDYLPVCIKKVEAVKNNEILHGIGELVEADQKPWIKNSLKKDAIFLLKLRLELLKKYEKEKK